MCDCAEEAERRQAEEESQRAASEEQIPRDGERRKRTGVPQGSQSDQGSCVRSDGCGFFSCGVGSSGGWLPAAGSALVLAMLAFLYKHMGKLRRLLGARPVQGPAKAKRGFDNCARDYYATVRGGK
ncbi:unnamed protein product, partial [Iphiclides podalirius]